jgi:two-component system, LuxR family, sensor kinase FixL
MSEDRTRINSDCLEDLAAVPEWASALTEAIPAPAAVMSPDGRVLHANNCLRLIVGSDGTPDESSETPPGRPDGAPELLLGLRRLLDSAARTGSAGGEIPLGPAWGNQAGAVVQVHARVLSATWDRCLLILVTIGQTNAAEMLQRRLGDSEHRYRQLLQASMDLVFLMELDGTLASVNRAWQQRTGYTAAEGLGENGLDLVTPECRKVCSDALERAGSGQYVEDLEFRAVKKDGGHIDVLVNLAPVRDNQGQVVQIIGAGRDITEFKRTQGELKNSEERLRILFEYAPDAYYLNDLKGTFLDGNKAAEEMCGYRKEELVGKNFLRLDLLPKNQLPKAAGVLAKNALGRPGGPVEFRLNRKDGTQVDVEIRTYPVQIAGQTVILGMARDISERKKTEAMLEALNRDLKSTIADLERSNQELRDFAHVAAHDLKAPLRGIASIAAWVEQDYADKLDQPGRENLALLRQRVERMTLLINGILRYAEIGHGDHSVEDVDTAEVVAEVIEQIGVPKHITIQAEGFLPVVPCERVPITQVFLNLISNAVKYMDKPKGRVRVAAAQEGDFWRFTVADNGMGIEERYFDRLFQMFQTLAPCSNGDSTGLGLAMVKKIVQIHGGRVGVESEPGRGSTFFFTLPKHKERTMYEKH